MIWIIKDLSVIAKQLSSCLAVIYFSHLSSVQKLIFYINFTFFLLFFGNTWALYWPLELLSIKLEANSSFCLVKSLSFGFLDVLLLEDCSFNAFVFELFFIVFSNQFLFIIVRSLFLLNRTFDCLFFMDSLDLIFRIIWWRILLKIFFLFL